jgi:hypothetical protein
MARDADQHAVARAQQLGALVEHYLNQARVLSVLARQRPGALARLDVAQPPDPPLGLGDDLVRDADDVAVTEVRRRGRGQRGSEVVAPPQLGQRAERDRLELQIRATAGAP